MTSVLESPPPSFSPADASRIARDVFGVEGAAQDLGSERDQTFLIGEDAVLKISNSGEDPAVLDLEHEAIRHVARVDPSLPLAQPRGRPVAVDGHFARLFDRVHGRRGGPDLPDDAVAAFGATHARLSLALRSFFHPAAGRALLWDLRRTADLRPILDAHPDARRRVLVERVLDRFDERVEPRWHELPAQVVHGDLNLDNVLLDERGRISGVVDFGDCGHTARVADLAIAVASLMRGRPAGDVFRVGRIAVDGYASRLPLEPVELELLGDLVAARLAMIVTISAWRVRRYPENAAYIQSWDADSWELLELFAELGGDAVARELGAPAPHVPTAELVERRAAAVGSLLTRLTYSEPVHVERGEGTWLFDVDGRRMLDAYNNVPVVGHCHPRVTEAVVRQTRRLNTHARYVYEPLVELAERLLATMPPEAGFDSVMLVNSGSEANDMAWRIATAATGHAGAIVTEHAYHGVTSAVAALSPEEWPDGFRPAHVARIPPPGSGADTATETARAVGELDGLAATFIDGALTSDGIYRPAADELAELVRQTHATGGLYVADEVQAGYGRTGAHLWSFAADGIAPDLVTLGKPMGNGYPVAALVTRRELVERFPFARRVFSTFGGNPVAAQAALAVLDTIEDERLVERAARTGARLLDAVRGLGHDAIVDVRGQGLIAGVELADPELAGRVVDDLRRDGVLIGRTGVHDEVLKIRPPLVFGDEHAELLVAALARALAA